MAQIYNDLQLGWESIIATPGHEGIKLISRNMDRYLCPWDAQEHYDILLEVQGIINEVDPALVVLDTLFTPAVDATRNLNRLHAFASPNPVSDSFPDRSPWGQVLWKYPAFSSGFPYPVPWRLIPQNVLMVLRMGLAIAHLPEITARRAFLASRGGGWSRTPSTTR